MTHCRRVMLEELQRRNFAPTTISTYLHAVEQFARHFKCRGGERSEVASSARGADRPGRTGNASDSAGLR